MHANAHTYTHTLCTHTHTFIDCTPDLPEDVAEELEKKLQAMDNVLEKEVRDSYAK